MEAEPFLAVGYYDTQSESLANLTRLRKQGVNWGMRYLTHDDPDVEYSDAWIKAFLDHSACGSR